VENRKQIMENFLRNKEILKLKKDGVLNVSSVGNTEINSTNVLNSHNNRFMPVVNNNADNNQAIHTTTGSSNQITDKLTEMKKTLQFLRSQKY
jgi:hypothetical protein